MPGSPAMTPTCRVPWRAVVHHWCSWANSPSRPTKRGGRTWARQADGGRLIPASGPPGDGSCHRDRGNEPIPPPVHRLDKLRAPRLIAQHPAQLPNGHRQDRLTHRRLGPDGRQQGVFGHELAGLRHQGASTPRVLWRKGARPGRATGARRADRAGMAQRQSRPVPAYVPPVMGARMGILKHCPKC